MLDPLMKDLMAAMSRMGRLKMLFPEGSQLTMGEMAVLHRLNAQHMGFGEPCDKGGHGHCPPFAGHPGDVSNMLHDMRVSRSAISQVMGSMEEKGFIKREINPGDRRKIRVMVTSQGDEALRRVYDYYDEITAELVERFSYEDMTKLTKLLTRLADVFDQIIDEKTNRPEDKA